MANITLPTPGGDADVWGQKLNTALNAVNVESTQNAATISTYANSKQNKLVAGANIMIDVSNPAAPVISATGGGSTIDAEQVRDIIGAAIAGSGNVTVVYDDAADTITVSTTATVNSTDAQLRDRSTHTGTQPQSTIVDLVTNLAAKAPLADPAFTGNPTAPTQTAGNNTTRLATTAFVTTAVSAASRPAVPWIVIYNAGNWEYKGAIITTRPAGMLTGDVIQFVGNPGGSLPSWAATNDIWTQG